MNKLKVMILESDISDLYRLVYLVNSISELELVFATTRAEELLKEINTNKFDIAILDLSISNTYGFEVAEFLTINYPNVKIIFISSYIEFGIRAYKYYPEDYLVKPINVFRLNQTVKRIMSHAFNFYKSKKMVIKNKGLSKFIDIEDINYIEKKKDNTKIHLVNEEIIDSKESLNDLEIKLQSYGFFRIHQSYIVPFKKIEEIKPDNYMKSYNLKLKDTDEILSLSRNKYKILKDMLFD